MLPLHSHDGTHLSATEWPEAIVAATNSSVRALTRRVGLTRAARGPFGRLDLLPPRGHVTIRARSQRISSRTRSNSLGRAQSDRCCGVSTWVVEPACAARVQPSVAPAR